MKDLRKSYTKNVYSKYWIDAREKIYGFSEYDKNLINLVLSLGRKGKFLEVAIGTGYPFGHYFSKQGLEVYGIDLAYSLIKKCNTVNGNIRCMLADAEDLPFFDNIFDVTYCFHSTWYFTNLIKSVSEMLRVTKSGGKIVFDIQNYNNPTIRAKFNKQKLKYSRRYFYYPFHYIKQTLKVIFRYRMNTISWKIIVHSTPTIPEHLYKFFNIKQLKYSVFVKNNHNKIIQVDKYDSCQKFDRIIIIAYK